MGSWLDADLDLHACFRWACLLGTFIGNAVLLADAAQAKRLVGVAKIAVRGIEVMIGFLDCRLRLRLPIQQMLHDGREVVDGKFHFDLKYDRSVFLFSVAGVELRLFMKSV